MGLITAIPSIRVLDLTDERGVLCGKLLAELGADVIKMEKPGGDPSRNLGPFFHDMPHPEKSLFWFAYNVGKRGITLNIETADGKEIFKRLADNADIVIESFHPGYMESLGLGYDILNKTNPRLIFVSITPFGQTGPYKNDKDSDLILAALGGFLYLTGDPDRPPVRISFPQSYLLGSSDAAIGALMAYYWREKTGKGQYVDESIQQSILSCTSNAPSRWELNKDLSQRTGNKRHGLNAFGTSPQLIWPCKDGYVAFLLLGGIIGKRSNKEIAQWIDGEGQASDALKNMDWDSYDMAQIKPEELAILEECIGKFFMSHTKEELYKGALERMIMVCPVCTLKDVFEDNQQLRARLFWQSIDCPELDGKVAYPGHFFSASEFSCAPLQRAPLIGEHNREIYEGELGLSQQELILLKQAKVI